MKFVNSLNKARFTVELRKLNPSATQQLIDDEFSVYEADKNDYEYVGESVAGASSEFSEVVVTSSPFLDAIREKVKNGTLNFGGGNGALSVLPRLFPNEITGAKTEKLALQLSKALPSVLASVAFLKGEVIENPRFDESKPANKNGNFEEIVNMDFSAKTVKGETFEFSLSPNASISEKFASRYPENQVIEIKDAKVFKANYYKIGSDAANISFKIA